MFFSRFNRFIKYFGKGYKLKLLNILFMAFMSSLLEFLSIVLVFPFIMIMVNPGRVVYNPLAGYFHELLHINSVPGMILFFGSLIAGVIIIKNLYSILITYWQNKMISQWGLEVKEKMIKFVLYSPYESDIVRGNSNIIQRINDNVDSVMTFYVFKMIGLVSNTIVIILIFSVLIFLLPMFTIAAILFFTTAGLCQGEIFRRISEDLSIKRIKLTQGPYESVMNSLKQLKDIKINGCQKFFFDFFSNISKKIIPYKEKLTLIPLIPQYIIEIIFIMTMTILCLGILNKYGENPSNILVSFGVVAIAIYRVVPQIYKNQVYLNYININTVKMDQLLKLYEEYIKYEYPKNPDSMERMEFNNQITVNDLSYSYDKKSNVIEGISLEIKKGEFIGIVGLSGAGKTTFVDCLLGLLAYKGEIYVDNVLLTEDNIRTFRNIIGYVPQKITTIEGDIYSNVAWGVERKDIDKERVDEVLKISQLFEQLKQTENGLEIELKQDGTGLSGGQLQRIGIARALYRNPEIILLDEATSNLDVKIENKLTEVISNIKGSKTIIAIAHRLSTLVNCDRIIYLNEGRLVDVGTFQELSDKHADFKEILKLSRIKLDD